MKKKVKEPVKKGGVAKVPVIIQMEALECGATSLAMILAYYDKWVPPEQVRVDCGVSRDGSNAKNVLLAARNYGLDAKGYRFEPESLKEEGIFPCIIHWNFNHFVVCDGFKGNKAYLNDPARGFVKVSMEELQECDHLCRFDDGDFLSVLDHQSGHVPGLPGSSFEPAESGMDRSVYHVDVSFGDRSDHCQTLQYGLLFEDQRQDVDRRFGFLHVEGHAHADGILLTAHDG